MDKDDNCNSATHFFEGVEKLLEVWFTRQDGKIQNCDLRRITRLALAFPRQTHLQIQVSSCFFFRPFKASSRFRFGFSFVQAAGDQFSSHRGIIFVLSVIFFGSSSSNHGDQFRSFRGNQFPLAASHYEPAAIL